MSTLTLSSKGALSEAPTQVIQRIREELSLKNPAFVEAKKHGRWTGSLDEWLMFYELNGKDGIVFPRGYARRAWALCVEHGQTPILEDHRRALEPLQIDFRGELREYQQKALRDILRRDDGVLEASTGSGKTVMGLAAIAARKQPVLIVVHTKELLQQWQERTKSFLDVSPGQIGGGKFDVQPITVAMVQTLRKHLDTLPEHFGHLVVDECFPAGTSISTPSGNIEIQKLKVGDKITGFDHQTGKIVETQVEHVFRSNTQELVKVNLEAGENLLCTKNHPFFTGDSYTAAWDLTPGQAVWRKKDCCRGGRRFTCGLSSNYRQKESKMLEAIRVEGVETIQQANRGGLGWKREDSPVYNIETGTGNYFAEGFLVHNCHRTPSSTFSECVKAFDVKYLLGLSATPYRRDGLSKLIYWTLGEPVHTVDPSQLRDSGAVLKPAIVLKETDFQYHYEDDYPALVSALTEDFIRNFTIIEDIYLELTEGQGGTCLVVSDRRDHLLRLIETLGYMDTNLSVALLTGQTPKGEREKIVEDLNAGSIQVLFSTSQLISEGFDCPGLSSLFLTCPIKYHGKLIQVLGRILRPANGKQPRVYDYLDLKQPVLRAQAKARQRAYKEIAAQ